MKSKCKCKPPQGTKNKRGIRLIEAKDIRRLLSRLINQALRGEIEVDLLRGVTYATSMILRSLELGEMSDRLDRIERKLSL